LTIVYRQGKSFWIEQLNVQITVSDGAGVYDSSAQALEEGGTFIGASYVGRGDGGEVTVGSSLGQVSMRTSGGANMNVGNNIVDFLMRVHKQITAVGDTTIAFSVLIFLTGKKR